MRRLALAFGAVAALAPVGAARGHGPAPAALEALRARDGAPDVVRLGFGLAVRTPDAGAPFRYVCPAAWGADDVVPRMAVTAEGGVVIPWRGGVFLASPDVCRVEALDTSAWGDESPVAVAGTTRVTIASRSGEGSSLWALSPEGTGLTRIAAWADLSVDSGLAASDGTQFWAAARPVPTLVTLAADGATRVDPLDLDAAPQFIELRWAQSSGALIFVATTDAGVVAYESVDGGRTSRRLLVAEERLHGPLPHGGALWAVADAVLWRRPAGAAECEALGASPYTCLQAIDGLLLACRDRDLVALAPSDGGLVESPFFSLADLHGPTRACAATASEACAGQWRHFAGEGGLYRADVGAGAPEGETADAGATDAAAADARVVPAAGGAAVDAGGCRVCGRGRGRGDVWLGALLLALAWRGRSALSKRWRIP